MPSQISKARDNSFNLKSVKSHAQLTQTANNVRIISQNLSNATIKLNIKTIMVVTKPGDRQLVTLTKELVTWLIKNYSYLDIYIDRHLEKKITFESSEKKVKFWKEDLFEKDPSYSDVFDLIITLGGDGTVLFVSQLFQQIVPPILAFSLGSLGFLTNFKFKNYKKILAKILKLKYVKTNLRLRFSCDIIEASSSKVIMSKRILNEVTIDRGPNPFLTNLALYGNDSLITLTQADGLCIATPTGSTAYSLAAGGSLVHPSVSAISVTPICPHTLSFRPIILPDSMELKVVIPHNSRCETSWVSFDGKSRFELNKNYYLVITASEYYFPTVMNGNNEYFDSVSNNLNWNTRKHQKPLNFNDNYANLNKPGKSNVPTNGIGITARNDGGSSVMYDSDDQIGFSDNIETEDDDFDDDDDDATGFLAMNSSEFYNASNSAFSSDVEEEETNHDDSESDLDEKDDYIETPIIPFEDINEALEIFSDEEHVHGAHKLAPIPKSRSGSMNSSRRIRTNSFTNFNQVYREKLRIDTSKKNSPKINGYNKVLHSPLPGKFFINNSQNNSASNVNLSQSQTHSPTSSRRPDTRSSSSSADENQKNGT